MRRRRPSALGAALRSVLVPGWGQLATSRSTAGRLLVFFSGLCVISGLTVFLFVEPVDVAAWLADPDVILGVILVDLVFLAVRLLSTEHAWRAGGGHRWYAAILLATIVSIPHVAIGWVGLETRDSLLRLFPNRPNDVAAPDLVPQDPTTTTSSSPTTTSTTLHLELTPIVTIPGQYADDRIDISPTDGWQPFGVERLNILLLGGDAGPGRSGLRTDTMIAASIDPITGDAALFGLPRNFAGVALTDGTPIPVSQLGHVYGWGRRHDELFSGPDPGAAAVADAVSNITGLEIDYFVLVDLTGFADVIDAFGGVSLNVSEPVDGPLYDVVTGGYEMVSIPIGTQHLDGAHALAYARARYGSSDYARMARQRCILASMAAQADLLDLFSRLSGILDAVEANLVTDLPADLVPELIRLTSRVSAANTRMIGFDPSWGTYPPDGGRAVPDVQRIRDAVRVTIESPGSSEELGVTTAAGC